MEHIYHEAAAGGLEQLVLLSNLPICLCIAEISSQIPVMGPAGWTQYNPAPISHTEGQTSTAAGAKPPAVIAVPLSSAVSSGAIKA
jgi:hypothetical protein